MLLEGTGNALWQTMYRAAETFSRQAAYPAHPFPHLESDAHCVLCQQPYAADAAERMRRFAAFVADSATADAQAANVARLEALEKVKAVDRSVLDAPTLAEVAERLPDLHVAITAAESVWAARHARVTQTLEAGKWPRSQRRFRRKRTWMVSSPPRPPRCARTPRPCVTPLIPPYGWP